MQLSRLKLKIVSFTKNNESVKVEDFGSSRTHFTGKVVLVHQIMFELAQMRKKITSAFRLQNSNLKFFKKNVITHLKV